MNDSYRVESKLSVAVCTRNRARLLEGCLSSLARLSPAPLEVIIVDQSDGAESARVVGRFRDRIRELRHLPTSSRGLSRARNAAIRAAHGEILAFTDDDCLVRSNWVGEVARAFAEDSKLVMVTGGSLPAADEKVDPRILAAATWYPEEAHVFERPVEPAVVGGGFNLSLRLAWVKTVGLFDPELGPGGRFRGADDTDFIHRTLVAGGCIRYEPRVLVSHATWRDGRSQSRVEFEYGYGLAAWALKSLHQGDRFPIKVALRTLMSQGKRILSGVIRGDAVARETGWSYVSGLGRGAVAWIWRGNSSGEKPKTGEGREVSA